MKQPSRGWRTGAGLAVLLLATACGSAEQRLGRAMARGAEYYAAGNYEKARVEYRNALQVAPNDAEARYQAGRVAEKLGNLREAAQLYQGAIDARSDHLGARAELARMYLLGGAPDRAMELVKPGLEKAPDDVALLVVRAASRAQLKDTAGAFEDAEHAYRLDPKNENAVAVLAGLYNGNARSDRAEALLAGGVAARPDSVDLRLALAQLQASLGKDAEAQAQLREIVRLKPSDRAHRIRLAQFLVNRKDDAGAEGVLRAGVAALPEDREMKLSVVDFLAARRGRPQAEQELRRLIAAAPGDYELQFALARFQEQGGDAAAADALYRAVIAKEGTRPPALTARNRLAASLAARGDLKGAEPLVAEVLAANAQDNDALNLRGNLLLARGDAKGAIADLRAALRDQPNASGILRVLARAHVRNGEPALAEETLRRAVDANPTDAGARLDLAQFLVQSGKREAGRALLAQLAKERPADAAVQDASFRAALAARDLPAAHAAVDALQAAQPASAVGPYFAGALAEAEGRNADALRGYEAALALQPDAMEAFHARVRLLVRLQRLPEALRTLDAEAARTPANPVPLNLKGELLLGEKRYAEAQASFQAAVARAPRWWIARRGLAYVALAQGDVPRATALLRDALPAVDEPAQLRAELAILHETHGQPDQAIAEYEAILAADPRGLAAANNLAMLLVSYRTDAPSLERAAQLAQPLGSSANPLYLDTYGWVKLKRGDAAGALEVLERAHAAAPDAAAVRYHLAMAQLAVQQKDRARQNLQAALGSGQRFQGMESARVALADLSR